MCEWPLIDRARCMLDILDSGARCMLFLSDKIRGLGIENNLNLISNFKWVKSSACSLLPSPLGPIGCSQHLAWECDLSL